MKYTLAFDVYGTLINTSGVYDTLKYLVGKDAKAFMDTWRNKQLEYSFRRGLMNKYADFSVCTRDSLEYCCKAFKIDFDAAQKDALLVAYTVLPSFPDVKNGLKQLKKSGHKLYAFSNGSSRAITDLLINADLYELFDGIVSAEDIQVFKPSPLVYKHFNKVTNSSKADSWLISSNPFDVIGAVSYGMRSAWVQRSEDSIFDPWGIEPTATVCAITDLNEKLNTSK